MARPSHHIAVAKNLAEVDALREEWDALERRTPEATGFQSFAWCRTWLATAMAPGRTRLAPRVVTVRENGRLVMLWPLQVDARFGVRTIRWIGEPLTQYGDALAEQGAARELWRDLAEREMRRWGDADLVLLPRIRGDGVLAVADGAAHRRPEPLVPDRLAPYLDLTGGAPLRIAKDKSVARRERKLGAEGSIALETSDTPEARVQSARRALALKQAWLRQRRLFSLGLSDPCAARFIEELARVGALEVNVLRVDGTAVAIDLGLIGGTSYRSFLAAFDETFAHGSPGNVLTARLVQRCRDAGLDRFDLLAPADPYKTKWADGTIALGVRKQALTWRGVAFGFALTRLRPLAKRGVLALGRWRRRLAARGEAAASSGASDRPARKRFVFEAALRMAGSMAFRAFL